MALIAGAGNPTGGGASFSGPAQTLEIINSSDGKTSFCYAYSGNLTLASATVVTCLQFTTGNYIVKGIFEASVDADALSTDFFRIFIELNGVSIVYNLEQRGGGSPTGDWINLVIPPYTTVKVSLQGANSATATGWITGRIYR